MSDTPRTDDTLKWVHNGLGSKYANIDAMAARCIELELENTKISLEAAELARENAALLADRDRLDWLDRYISTDDTNQLFPKIKRADCHSIREAIDAAREKEAKP